MTTAPNTEGPRPQSTANERLRDPDQVKRDARAVSYEWELGKDEDGGTRLVVLSVSHTSARAAAPSPPRFAT